MKKILIVGGGVNQMPLVLAAKREGYEVIVVDYAGEGCPAYTVADRSYNVSTLDEEGILDVARKEGIDGIISNSEPSMIIVNSIAEKLNLTGNPVEGIRDLISKSRFRDLQRRTGCYAPVGYEVETAEEAINMSKRLRCPLVVKPCESSGSRGFRKIERYDQHEISDAFEVCKHYSRNKKVVIEEYVAMPSLRTIEGDIFVSGDSVLWDGLFYTIRASWAPEVPMTYSAPLLIDNARLDVIKSSVLRILKASGVRFGEFNIEGFFTETGEFFIIEINVRQGGNFLPHFLQRFTGIDYHRLLVTTCVNDDEYLKTVMAMERHYRYVIMHSVYSREEGIYQGLRYEPPIKNKIANVTELLSVGDKVEKCIDGSSIVASVDLDFGSPDELHAFIPQIMNGIHVELSNAS